MWSQARKSYRSPDKTASQPQPLSTTCLLTPFKFEKPTHRQSSRQCPLHFNQPTHICLTCRKSICLRCALTYCQSHVIRVQGDGILQVRQQLARLQLIPKLQQIQLKLQQSRERQQYLQKKALKLIEGIESHFEYIMDMLVKKKLQIIQYYDSEFQNYLQEHRSYDAELKERAEWIKLFTLEGEIDRLGTIEEIQSLSNQIKRSTIEDIKTEKKLTKILMGKDKIKIEKMWSQENLQKVLYEIEHINFKIQVAKVQKRKKRVTTQNAMQHHSNTIGFVKSSSNSRLPSGRKHVTPFNV